MSAFEQIPEESERVRIFKEFLKAMKVLRNVSYINLTCYDVTISLLLMVMERRKKQMELLKRKLKKKKRKQKRKERKRN